MTGGAVAQNRPMTSQLQPEQEPERSAGAGATVGLSAGLVTMFLLLRLLAVSGWDWAHAGAIADSFDFSDAIPIVLGTLFSAPDFTGALIAVLLPLAAIGMLWPGVRRQRPHLLAAVMLVAALIGGAVAFAHTYHSWWILIAAAIIGAAVSALYALFTHGRVHRAVQWVLRSVGMLTVLAAFVLAVVADTPWMSREHLELTGDRAIEGYVLDVSPGFVKLITDDRDVDIIPTGDIESRTIVDG